MVGALAGGQRVVVLHKNALEGFSCEESVFVARLLRVLGVATLVHTLIAGTHRTRRTRRTRTRD